MTENVDGLEAMAMEGLSEKVNTGAQEVTATSSATSSAASSDGGSGYAEAEVGLVCRAHGHFDTGKRVSERD